MRALLLTLLLAACDAPTLPQHESQRMIMMTAALSRGHRRPYVTYGSTYAAPDIASHDFEDGTDGVFGSTASVDFPADPTGALSGKVARIRYNDAGGADTNRYLEYQMSVGTQITSGSVFVRADIYTPTGAGSTNTDRKLFYIFPRDGNALHITSGLFLNGTDLRWFGGNVQTNGAQLEYSTGYTWPFNTKVTVELETYLGTVGNPDGRARVWINGSQVWENNTGTQPITFKSASGDDIGYFQIGNQFHWLAGATAYDEFRYLDRLALSTQRIGP